METKSSLNLGVEVLSHMLNTSISSLIQKPKTALRTANQRLTDALSQPEILSLLSNIWMTNELHLLFADTGVGKSLLAVQICDALSKGCNIFNFNMPSRSYRINFYDLELTDRQFLKRYTDDGGNLHGFSENFLIDNIDFVELVNENPKKSVEELIFNKIEKDLDIYKPDIIVIDNISFLNTQTTQETQTALEVMRKLNDLKKKYGISILVLAHTPKRNLTQSLSINDLAGSKHLSNFADSISAIGTSTLDSKFRYIKQIKPSRSSELIYDSTNVITCELVKKDCLLGFEFIKCSSEKEHLMEKDEKRRIEDKNLANSLLGQGMTLREVAEKIGTSKSTIGRWKDELSQQSHNGIPGTAGQTGHDDE
ncbi:MAG: AAA family ATPase [Bacteroidetes bacterium]|jgi:archaellum biogenesis ATPase FlaH|nr:AAA family ATPase [Bacteroidota bacterium]MBT5531346.1 AAA family ATPase [Cytophagia bacterium]MBT3799760.1 AAA family ATPase [Bacteroidota bacterium]MBT3935564.1 AAA family ATPase [Bacteroidota bacterium]MBT4339556.1 AAA family ATPase [Bacteroidota bacterium]